MIFRMILIVALAAVPAWCQRKQGSPLDKLPKNIEQLTYFGERADFSPDSQSVAFMAKSFGDAFVVDLKTRVIRCLTCNVPGAAFLRVMHLANGDYMLIGAEKFKDITGVDGTPACGMPVAPVWQATQAISSTRFAFLRTFTL